MNKLERTNNNFFSVKGYTIYIVYLGVGIFLNHKVKFEAFYLFTSIFTFIFWIANSAIFNFSKNCKKIIALTVKEPPTEKARVSLYKNLYSNRNYILPICVVMIFSLGGCMLYSSLKITPTFIWCMSLFIPTVYFSICGYLYFVYLEYYIYQIAHSKKRYKHLPMIKSISLPPEIDWFSKIKKLALIYQISFFSVGSLFICAFAAFCHIDAFAVSQKSIICILLWTIIIFAIVIAFPLMVKIENKNIDKIQINIQTYYFMLSKKEKIPSEVENSFNGLFLDFIRNQIIKHIVNQDKTDFKFYIRKGYALITSIFNITVSVFSLLDIFDVI